MYLLLITRGVVTQGLLYEMLDYLCLQIFILSFPNYTNPNTPHQP